MTFRTRNHSPPEPKLAEPRAGSIFAHGLSERASHSGSPYHRRDRRPRTLPTSPSAAGRGGAACRKSRVPSVAKIHRAAAVEFKFQAIQCIETSTLLNQRCLLAQWDAQNTFATVSIGRHRQMSRTAPSSCVVRAEWRKGPVRTRRRTRRALASLPRQIWPASPIPLSACLPLPLAGPPQTHQTVDF